MMFWQEIKSLYGPAYSRTVVYMLQATEYQIANYLKWFWRLKSFSRVAYRKQLVLTRPARLLLLALQIGILLNLLSIIYIFLRAVIDGHVFLIFTDLAFLIITPVLWAHLIIIPLLIGRWIVTPLNSRKISRAEKIFRSHPATKIAIAGSYGKTSMKEILNTILSADRKVAATSGNRNVPVSHAAFAYSLSGNEDVLLIEYGEGAPGDVKRFVANTHPNIGIITGLAPAHLDKYKTLEAAGRDIFSLAEHLEPVNVYINKESKEARSFIRPRYQLYDATGVSGWKVSSLKNSLDGLSFYLQKGQQKIYIKTRLLGKHQVGPIACAVTVAEQLGVPIKKIEKAATQLKPYEHRMEPYQLSGAWIIDDTYNGNIEGMAAGLKMLSDLPARRKIYVTPGLVDQGPESPQIHQKLGKLIAESEPDLVILMKHSVADDIIKGLRGYKGQVIIEDDPLNFYTHLDQFVAAGDLVLMQNDWPDNYT